MSPLARTLKVLNENGWLVAKVEHYNAFSKRRVDLFGFIDVLAIKNGRVLALQPTTRANISHRVKKIEHSPCLGMILEAGWIVEVWGWAKVRTPENKRLTWRPRRVRIGCSESSQG